LARFRRVASCAALARFKAALAPIDSATFLTALKPASIGAGGLNLRSRERKSSRSVSRPLSASASSASLRASTSGRNVDSSSADMASARVRIVYISSSSLISPVAEDSSILARAR